MALIMPGGDLKLGAPSPRQPPTCAFAHLSFSGVTCGWVSVQVSRPLPCASPYRSSP